MGYYGGILPDEDIKEFYNKSYFVIRRDIC